MENDRRPGGADDLPVRDLGEGLGSAMDRRPVPRRARPQTDESVGVLDPLHRGIFRFGKRSLHSFLSPLKLICKPVPGIKKTSSSSRIFTRAFIRTGISVFMIALMSRVLALRIRFSRFCISGGKLFIDILPADRRPWFWSKKLWGLWIRLTSSCPRNNNPCSISCCLSSCPSKSIQSEGHRRRYGNAWSGA